MPRLFDSQLVNDPFGDPALYVDLAFERRALLFDLGDLTPLAPRKLMRVSEAFVSHCHMDHFAGFDHLLRFLLGRGKTVGLYGPPGLIEAVGHKLAAYTWNLIRGYDGNLVFRVHELARDGRLRVARFAGRAGFVREDEADEAIANGVLLREPGFLVRTAALDHGIPSLAFALEERAHINICRNRLAEMGLAVGPWLRAFKQAILSGAPEHMAVEVAWSVAAPGRPRTRPLGELRQRIIQVGAGRKIAYVVDAAFTPANTAAIVALARGADILFIEAPFLHCDAERSAARHHLTARQAGTLARLAGVKRIAPFHYSPRYTGRGACLAGEAEAAFRACQPSTESM